jgi:predicted membrane protein
MMLDIFISVILLFLFLFPSVLKSMNTIIGKIIILICIYLINTQNMLLGFMAAVLFIYQLSDSLEQFSPKSKTIFKHSLLPLDENIRPKESNKIKVSRESIAPSTQELSGSIQGPVSSNNTGEYTQFNI